MKLEEIRDILRFVNQFFSERSRSLDIKSPDFEDSKIGAFYKILTDTAIQSDHDAAMNIYGTREPDTKYMFLKSHFISRMLNTITHIDLSDPKISGYTKAVFNSYKQLFIVSALLRLGRRKGAMSLAMKTLRLAVKYELHHVAVELLEQFRANALLEGEKTEYEKYVKALERTFDLLRSESKVRTLEQRLQIFSSSSTYIKESLAVPTLEALKETENELLVHDTYLNRMAYFRLQYMYYQYAGSPSRSIAACERAIAYMHTKPHLTPPIRFGEYALYILENCNLAHDYKNGKKAALQCWKYIPNDSSYWFQYKEQYFLLLLYKLKFSEAKIVYEECMANLRLHSQLQTLEERWNIYKLYLDYAGDIEKRETLPGKRKRSYLLQQKKYQKIIKEYPTYSNDKRGLNVAILLLNILLLLENDKKDQLIEQYEALLTYRSSHLKGTNSHQSSILFKLIDIMVKNEFDFARMEKKAAVYEKRLSQTQPSRHEIMECVQIMPAMWVWQRMKVALVYFQPVKGKDGFKFKA